jgi:hypothetical protein
MTDEVIVMQPLHHDGSLALGQGSNSGKFTARSVNNTIDVFSSIRKDGNGPLRLSAWYFGDEMMRRLVRGNSLSPVRKNCSSHFPLPTSAFDS